MPSSPKSISRAVRSARLRLLRRFFLIVIPLVAVYSIAALSGAIIYGVNRDPAKTATPKPSQGLRPTATPTQEEEEEDQRFTNIAVFGCDDSGNLADVDFVVSLNHQTSEVHLISVPRDTQVILTDEMLADLRSRNLPIPYNRGVEGMCKLTEVHSYAGDGYRCQYSTAMLEEILDIPIDYYIKFTPKTFRYVVDAIGGVDFYVPMDMYWDMRDHGGPLINLQEGMQHLDGDKAEQLVRFRHGYASQDLQRIEVQHDFMMAVIEKVFSTETILNNLPALTKTCLSYLETNMTIMDALSYLKFLDQIDVSSIQMVTLPGEAGNYVILDEDAVAQIVKDIFEPSTNQETQNDSSDTENTTSAA